MTLSIKNKKFSIDTKNNKFKYHLDFTTDDYEEFQKLIKLIDTFNNEKKPKRKM